MGNIKFVKDVKAIEKEYGATLFSMGFTFLLDVGRISLDNAKYVQEICKEVQERVAQNSILSADYQCEIIRCAAELAKFSNLELIRYFNHNFKFGK